MFGVFKEAERIKELEFVVKLRCFSAKMEKTLKNHQKSAWKKHCLAVFQSLLHFGWKTVQFDNKFEFFDLFCFSWPLKHTQARIDIEMEEILSKNATVWLALI